MLVNVALLCVLCDRMASLGCWEEQFSLLIRCFISKHSWRVAELELRRKLTASPLGSVLSAAIEQPVELIRLFKCFLFILQRKERKCKPGQCSTL